jgi:hypothetical protein
MNGSYSFEGTTKQLFGEQRVCCLVVVGASCRVARMGLCAACLGHLAWRPAMAMVPENFGNGQGIKDQLVEWQRSS